MKVLTEEHFDKEILKAKGPVVVDFWADWCGPCKMLMPTLDEISKERKDIQFYKMDTSCSGDIAGNMQIMSIPCLVFMNNGKEVNRMVGVHSKQKIIEWLEQCLKK